MPILLYTLTLVYFYYFKPLLSTANLPNLKYHIGKRGFFIL